MVAVAGVVSISVGALKDLKNQINVYLSILDKKNVHLEALSDVISSTLKCVMNRSRICSAGRSRRIIVSDSFLRMSPTNMYLM